MGHSLSEAMHTHKSQKGGASLICIKNHSLMNEEYRGDAPLQKKYTADFLAKKQVKNNGEIPQYYVEGDYPFQGRHGDHVTIHGRTAHFPKG